MIEKIVVYFAMQSFMNLFQLRNLIFCARACFLQLVHFLRPSSCFIRDFSAPLSTKGAGEKTEGGVCANAMPPTRTAVVAKLASALKSWSIYNPLSLVLMPQNVTVFKVRSRLMDPCELPKRRPECWTVGRKIILMIGAILALWTSSATAQRGLAVKHCVADLRKLCPGIEPGNDRLRACMREHIHDVSFPCLVTLAKFAEVGGLTKSAAPTLSNGVRAWSAKGDNSGLA